MPSLSRGKVHSSSHYFSRPRYRTGASYILHKVKELYIADIFFLQEIATWIVCTHFGRGGSLVLVQYICIILSIKEREVINFKLTQPDKKLPPQKKPKVNS